MLIRLIRWSVRATAGGIAIAGLLALVVSGCATAPQQTEPERLVWPAKPLPTRIEFERSIVSDEDLGHDTTFTQNVLHFLSGEKPAINRIVEPMGIAVSDDGQRVYISDFTRLAVYVFDFEHKTFKKIGDPEVLQRPMGLALDAQEQLYVVEQQKKGISVFDRQGKKLRFITDPSIERPAGIAIDRTRGKIYLADTSHTNSKNHNIKVFTMDGKLAATIGTKGSGPGQFLFPTYVALDPQGDLYVTDTLNARVQVFDPAGKYLKTIGTRGNGWGMFDKPKGVALDSFGNVYVADSGWSNVQIFNQKGQILIFFGGRGPLPGMLKNPTAIAVDKNNRIYVADYLNHRVEVYQLMNTTATDSFLNPPTAQTGGDPQLNRSTSSGDNPTQDTTHKTSLTRADNAHN